MSSNPKKFEGKMCLITGAASGIGNATVLKMRSMGATILACDIQPNPWEAGDSQINLAQLEWCYCDVSSTEACTAFVQQAVRGGKGIDFVFNCAGVKPTDTPLTKTTDEYYNKLMDVNLRGTFAISRAAIPHLNPGASIVNVASIMGTKGAAENAIYCATKWGVIGFTKSLALELGPKGFRVNAVAPGYIDTPTNASVVAGPEAIQRSEAKVAMGRMGTAEEIADVVAFLFSDEARYMNGSVVEINGGVP
ncbi:hypothetical protein B0A48_05669 [Cryoendolithus antarcticus]|uniref:3-oxoacyl-[acyl-carrier-protein] reductase FabG n=1 Tax=Cryoendolithus antarcticus TaxID=1507870 RepID=A0A1V8TBN4_9PEZI|nr:hypothetical protein B0A48_05669 [Cryoendolithus antarcticus]